MATPTARIDELNQLVTRLVGRLDKIESDVVWANEWVEKLRAADEEMRLRLLAIERDVADLVTLQPSELMLSASGGSCPVVA